MLLPIVVFALLGSIGAIFGAALLLTFPDAVRRLLLPFLESYAVKTLLAGAFLCLIPTGLEEAPPAPFMATVLGGILTFSLWRNSLSSGTALHTSRGLSTPPVGSS